MIDSWIEWKKHCALGLCCRDTQRRLQQFAFVRFKKMVRQCAHRTNVSNADSMTPSACNAWHLFETYLTAAPTERGKRYKDWLFARTRFSKDAPFDIIQGGATLLMRDVVREFLRREFSSSNMLSLHTPVRGRANESLTLEDMLPGGIGPDDETMLREYETLAQQHVDDVFDDMTRRERIAVLSKHIGVSLTHTVVEKAAGCRRSVLNDAYCGFVQRMASRLRRNYPGDDIESILTLTLTTFNHIKQRVIVWGRGERSCTRLFKTIGE